MSAIDDMEKNDPDWLRNPMGPAFKGVGITPEYLAKKIKEELEAEETKVFSGPKGVVYSKNMIAWQIRQRARQDAHKLMGDYPAEGLLGAMQGAKEVTLKVVYDDKSVKTDPED